MPIAVPLVLGLACLDIRDGSDASSILKATKYKNISRQRLNQLLQVNANRPWAKVVTSTDIKKTGFICLFFSANIINGIIRMNENNISGK